MPAEWRRRGQVGNLSAIVQKLLPDLIYTPPAKAGTGLADRQVALEFSLTALQDNGLPYSEAKPNPIGVQHRCPNPRQLSCGCSPGWSGPACDSPSSPGPLLVVSLVPADPAARIVFFRAASAATASGGPLQSALRATRGGHGTHVAGSAAGAALLDGRKGGNATEYNSLAAGAKLVIVDLLAGEGPYIHPPESLGSALMGKAHDEAGVRVFLIAWGCDDSDPSAGGGGKTCGAYPSGAWEIDEFVSQRPGLVVVLPAGETDSTGGGKVSGPAACRNCLTVGSTQNWPEDLAEGAVLGGECEPDDCPAAAGAAGADRPGACGSALVTSLQRTPGCCLQKYYPDAAEYGPGTVHWSSRSGLAGSNRIKPELLAPGLNVVC